MRASSLLPGAFSRLRWLLFRRDMERMPRLRDVGLFGSGGAGPASGKTVSPSRPFACTLRLSIVWICRRQEAKFDLYDLQ